MGLAGEGRGAETNKRSTAKKRIREEPLGHRQWTTEIKKATAAAGRTEVIHHPWRRAGFPVSSMNCASWGLGRERRGG